MIARTTRTRAIALATVSSLALGSAAGAQEDAGFRIAIDGQAVAGDPRLSTPRARADRQLERAKLRVQFDGLEVRPRLAVLITNAAPPRAGDTLTVRSEMNYPAYVERGEIRIIDVAARGGERVLATAPITANGKASLRVPEGEALVMTYRVYDANGRFDETRPLPLASATAAEGDFADEERGVDLGGIRRIPVYGGAVTVSGSGVRQGAFIDTLGERVRPDASGNFVMQRILPAGDQAVAVQVSGAGENTYIERDILIPRAEWFSTAIVDLTYGRRFDDADGTLDRSYSYGRIAGYAKGKTQSGWVLTGSIDTGEDDLSDLFRDLDEKDPQDVLIRLARENAYPTYGDDSTFEEGAPTDGKFYLRAERNGSHIMWGNYVASVGGGYYLRNERTLYGAQGLYRSPKTTSRGQSRLTLEAYAANPEQLPGRDSFLGTGGSVYFLQRQDIAVDSEVVSVDIRDRDTGRVVESRSLVAGRDYRVNYLQGSVVLNAPLNGSVGQGTVVTDPGGAYDVVLVVNYEYTPVAGDVDGMSYGGRAHGWITDNLRMGYTGLVEQTDIADQTAQSVDLLWELSERSFLSLEYAETEGPGFASSFSTDGGLIIDNRPTAGVADGTGEGYAARMQLDFADVGLQTPGTFAAYYETRDQGFSTLDYQTTADEELWGISFSAEPSERLTYRFYFDSFENDDGRRKREGGAELSYVVSKRVKLDFGIEHLTREDPLSATNKTGSRTDAAVRATLVENADFSWYVFGQTTLGRSGELEKNDRLGAGLSYGFAENWTFTGELSDGSLGVAGAAQLEYSSGEYDSVYLGYRLDPGREITGATPTGRDRGQYVAGGKRRLHQDVDIYAENTYDLFGSYRALTSTYGVEYRSTDALTLSASYDFGTVENIDGDLDRKALSLGARYTDEGALSWRARAEFRRDRGDSLDTSRDQDAFLFVGSARYDLTEAHRLVFSIDYADIDAESGSFVSGKYIDTQVGYAYRPILHDRLNLLFKYRYLKDTVGQEIDGGDGRGPRQISHILSLDADYDYNTSWTIGGKVGGRWGQSAPDDTIALADNDAFLGVLNARYHLTHKWDLLIEGRHLEAQDAGLAETSFVGAIYRHLGSNVKLGLGYNSGSFSDDLSDLTYDDEGVFLNFIAKF
ncbi:hypothetical protein ACNQ62_00955 [Sulfitobacter sp. SBS6]|uniref:hypothetical protein n=1 Tax=Sulfitobacter sp. SBS6 TaxID=3401755 RepID=UPI003AAD6F2A